MSGAPEAFKAHLARATEEYRAGNLEGAVDAWRAAARLDRANPTLHVNIGLALRKLGRKEEAIGALERAASLQPHGSKGLSTLGALYKDEHRFEDAQKVYERLLELEPGSREGLLGLAAIYERTGKVAAAYHLLRPLIDADTDDLMIINAYAIVAHRLEPPAEDAVPLLEGLLERVSMPADVRRKVLIALGNLNDALERPEQAFRYFERVHELDELPQGGERAKVQGIIAASIKSYTPERLARLPRARQESELPVFILGMARSGTTLTEQILSSHPQVHGAGELMSMPLLSVGLGRRAPYPDCLEQLTQRDVDGMAQQVLDDLRKRSPTALRVTDKMPFNFSHLGLIQLLFPRSRVVHSMRHPLDTCLSVYFNELTNFTQNHDLEMLAQYYREYWEAMRYWKQTLSLPILENRYEAMIAEPEKASRRLVDFCGLEWDDACLRFHESTRVVDTLSYYQVRRPIYSRSVGRWKPYEPFLGTLKERLADIIAEYEAGAAG